MSNIQLKSGVVNRFVMAAFIVLSTNVALAAEETPIPTDVAPKDQELMQQAADGEVAVPRVRKFVKPNRALMKASVANQKVGIAFMEENQHKPGVVTLKSGLQYKVIKAGSGAKPAEEDVIKTNYRGALVDGTVFEQSEPGKPANVKVGVLTEGLKEAIKLMPTGAKWQVFIPPELGFGSVGKMPKVGPDAVLIYDLELLGIVAPTPGAR